MAKNWCDDSFEHSMSNFDHQDSEIHGKTVRISSPEVQSDDTNVNNMATSYSNIAKSRINTEDPNINTVKPIFIKESDILGEDKHIPKEFWLTHVEIYKSIGQVVPPQCIRGIQRVYRVWRIYMDNEEDKQKLLIEGIVLRSKKVQMYPHNPSRPIQGDVMFVTVSNIPLSADDGQIERAVTSRNIEVINLSRTRLRVDGKLTNCQTGERTIVCKRFETPLPKEMKIGKYLAKIYHRGQLRDEDIFICNKCMEKGHNINNCPNEWKCRGCMKSGHKMLECPNFLERKGNNDTSQAEKEQVDETEERTEYFQDTADDSDESETDNEQSQSQSILQPRQEVKEQSAVKSKKKTQQKANEKNPSTQSKKTDIRNNRKNSDNTQTKEKNSKKDGSEGKKQSNMNDYTTPRGRGSRDAEHYKRTPPTPQDRDTKIPKR